MKHFAVLGNPISHSRSPEIFNSAFAAVGFEGCYSRLLTETADEAMRLFDSLKLSGMNVTAPFKKEITKYCDDMTPEAKKINAVNLVIASKGKKSGFNTDCIGVADVIKNHGVIPNKAIILGAGSAARAAIYALQKSGCREIITAARSGSKNAAEAQSDFSVKSIEIKDIRKYLTETDLLISTLPHGASARLVQSDFEFAKPVIFDANYNDSLFESISQICGLDFISGREWLAAQAQPCFRKFTGCTDFHYSTAAAEKKNIALIGFSGSGKSTVGAELAKLSGWNFVDIDERITNKYGSTAAEIFQEFGENEFRSAETAELKEVMNKSKIIVGCGGGIIERSENLCELAENAFRIRLYADFNTCIRRIATGEKRPLAVDPGTAEKLFEKRNSVYFENSDLNTTTEGRTAELAAGLIFNDLTNSGIFHD